MNEIVVREGFMSATPYSLSENVLAFPVVVPGPEFRTYRRNDHPGDQSNRHNGSTNHAPEFQHDRPQ
jgi:hypothetical protein